MELFYSSGACSMAPHIALIESGMDYKLHKVNLREGEQKKPEYLKVNPKGSVPALKLKSGEVLTEASLLLQYIADQHPEKKMIHTLGTTERYREMEWLNYISSEIHKGFGAYFGLGQFKNPQTASEVREAYDTKMKTRMEFLNNHFAQHQFLMGDNFTVPDAYLFTVLNWCEGIKFDLSPYSNVTKYLERMKTRPAVQKAMAEEGISGTKH